MPLNPKRLVDVLPPSTLSGLAPWQSRVRGFLLDSGEEVIGTYSLPYSLTSFGLYNSNAIMADLVQKDYRV